ncbi:MAG: hypothetical protein U0892_01785 [Pirellulales bacterium]
MLSRFVRIGTTLVVLGVMALSAAAQDQPPGGRGGRGGAGGAGGGPGGGFGRGGMMGGMGQGGAAQLLGLLRAPEVRKEVGLSDETYAAVEKAQEEMRQGGGPGGAAGGTNMRERFQNASEEERNKIFAEMRAEGEKRAKEQNEKAQALLDEVLTPDGMNRLLGLFAQLNNYRSVSNELVAKKINLSEDSKKKIEAAQTKLREEMMAQFQGGRGGGGAPGAGGGGGGFNPEDMRARMEEAQKKQEEAVSSNMTDGERRLSKT